jgi:ABC-type dipeptide/oligopeptide/nickel transport system ATPase component
MDEGVVQAVDGVSFDVWPGQVVGIVGESGCSKSVTMKAVLQIVEEPGRITAGAMYFRRGAESLDEMAVERCPEGIAGLAGSGAGTSRPLPPRGRARPRWRRPRRGPRLTGARCPRNRGAWALSV